MPTSFGPDMSSFVKFVIILATILILVGGFYIALRRMTGGKLVTSGSEGSRSRQPRLGVVDVYDLDRTRQLVLLRRDNVEHLLLIGGPNDVVIESNIVRVASGKIHAPAEVSFERPEYASEAAGRILPDQQVRPVVENGAFRTHEADETPFAPPPMQPSFATQAPVLDPAPAQENPTAQQAAIAAASFAAVAAATQYGHEVVEQAEQIEVDVPDFLRDQHASRAPYHPPVVEPVHIPEPEVTLEKAPEPEAINIAGYHALQRAEPEKADTDPSKYDFTFGGLTNPLASYTDALPQEEAPLRQEPVFETSLPPVVEAPAAPEPFAVEPFVEIEAIAEAPEPEQPATIAEAPSVQLDESVFSDMARQLEEALKATGAVTAAPVEVAEDIVDPSLPDMTIPEPATEFSAPVQDPVDYHQPIETPVTAEATLEKLELQAEPALPSELQDEDAASQAEADKKAVDDPFSLDDIEAEFARLLGRSEDKTGKS